MPIEQFEFPEDQKNYGLGIYEVKGKGTPQEQKPHWPSSMHRHDFYEICLFLKKGGQHEIDFNTYPIARQSVHFLAPGQVHFLYRDTDFHAFLIPFQKELLPQIAEKRLAIFKYYSYPILQLNQSEWHNLFEHIQFLSGQIRRKPPKAVLHALFQSFVLQCDYYFQKNVSSKEESTLQSHQFENFLDLLESQFRRITTVEEYANLLNIGPAQLNYICKKVVGQTASKLIQERIILQAKRLLIHSTLSSKEIAFKLGFEDPSYFSRFFRKHTNTSPTQFRKMYQSKSDLSI